MTLEALYEEIKALHPEEIQQLLTMLKKDVEQSAAPCDFDTTLNEVMATYETSLRKLAQ